MDVKFDFNICDESDSQIHKQTYNGEEWGIKDDNLKPRITVQQCDLTEYKDPSFYALKNTVIEYCIQKTLNIGFNFKTFFAVNYVLCFICISRISRGLGSGLGIQITQTSILYIYLYVLYIKNKTPESLFLCSIWIHTKLYI